MYLHPDKVVSVERVLTRQRARQAVAQPQPVMPTTPQEALALHAGQTQMRLGAPQPASPGLVSALAQRLMTLRSQEGSAGGAY